MSQSQVMVKSTFLPFWGFCASGATGIGTIAHASFELIGDGTNAFRLVEMTVSMAAATASIFQLGRPAAKGITPTTPKAAQEQHGVRVGGVTSAVAWATEPTVPASFLATFHLAATIGSRVQQEFQDLWIPPTQTIVLWNSSATGAAIVSGVVECVV